MQTAIEAEATEFLGHDHYARNERVRDGFTQRFRPDDGQDHAPSGALFANVHAEGVFLTASIGPRGGRAAIYRRALDGSTFEKSEGGLPEWFGDNIDTGRLVVSGNEVAFGTSDGSIFLSKDGGESWEQIAHDLPAVRSIAVLP